uniref:Uncharacterized protein n=1 Tax=Rhizophora mucronata TaxID=61149 RepID=A0A2P2NG37_RHIMU
MFYAHLSFCSPRMFILLKICHCKGFDVDAEILDEVLKGGIGLK